MENFLGVDIGGTNVKFGVVSEKGELLNKVKFPTAKMKEEGNFVEKFKKALGKQLNEYPEIKKVGIGVPGTTSKDRSTTLELPNIPQLNGVRFLDKLKASFPEIIFHLDNDANAAALGEYYFSKSKMPDNFIFITLGTGVGGGAIIDGQIFKGGDGNGMEIGHIISSNGKSIEQNIGKKGILGMALTTLEGYEGYSVLSDRGVLNSKKVVKAAHESDELALEIFQEVGKYIGEAIVSSVRLLDIKTILIGGGVSETFDYVKKDMYRIIKKHLTPYYTNELEIKLATLGNNAGIVGAASLCFIND
ncbi:ROK family protein [Flammeovirgaceae bacterium SG7u.111]|nr:ROK family protein [Flammeovirgaceae bacterium SG7u.132]WPO33108.1 ROK family protein [Flammeovirgaceae bacterium SG7u.111]